MKITSFKNQTREELNLLVFLLVVCSCAYSDIKSNVVTDTQAKYCRALLCIGAEGNAIKLILTV